MEAMKMELSLKAPRDGAIAEVRAAAGDFVEADAVLVLLETDVASERRRPHRRSRPARRPAEREDDHPRRRQDRADRSPVRHRPATHRGHQLRQPEVGAATGRRRRGLRRHHAQARRALSGAGAERTGLRPRARRRRRRSRGVHRRLRSLQPQEHQRLDRRDRSSASSPVLERANADGVRVRGYVSTVLGCPYQGEVPVADVVRVARRLHALGCYEISLGDTIGVGTPAKAARDAARGRGAKCRCARWPCTSTTPAARRWPNILACLEEGVRVVDASVVRHRRLPLREGRQRQRRHRGRRLHAAGHGHGAPASTSTSSSRPAAGCPPCSAAPPAARSPRPRRPRDLENAACRPFPDRRRRGDTG